MVVTGQSRGDVAGGSALVESSTGEVVGSTTAEEFFGQTLTTSGGAGGTAAIVERQRRAEQQRQAREIPEVTAEATRIRQELAAETRRQLMDRDLTRQERLKIKQEFQRQKTDIEKRKQEEITKIEGGGERESIRGDTEEAKTLLDKVDEKVGEVIEKADEVVIGRELVQTVPRGTTVGIGLSDRPAVFDTVIERDITLKTAAEEAKGTLEIPSIIRESAGKGAGFFVGVVTDKTGFEGVEIKTEGRPAKEVEIPIRFVGSKIDDPSIIGGTDILEIPARGERTTTIFDPKRLREGVEFGTQTGILLATPTPIVATEFGILGAATALDPSKTPLERVIGGAEAGVGVFLGRRFLNQPVTKVKELPVKDPFAVEVTTVKEIGGQPKVLTLFEKRGQLEPDKLIIESTKGKELFNRLMGKAEDILNVRGRVIMSETKFVKPLGTGEDIFVAGRPLINLPRLQPKVRIERGREFRQFTPEAIVDTQPALVVTETIGEPSLATISRIVGATKQISLREFNQLPKTVQLRLKSLAERAAGRPVSLKDVPKVLNKEREVIQSLVSSQELFRLRRTPTTRDLLFTKPIQEPQLSLGVTTPITSRQTEFGKVTFETAEIIGKRPSRLDSLVIKLEQKEPSDIRFIPPQDIRKTPLSVTFADQKAIISAIPTPKARQPRPTTTITEPTQPALIGGGAETAFVSSTFTGTGQFELTTGGRQITSFNGASVIGGREETKLTTDIGTDIDVGAETKIDTEVVTTSGGLTREFQEFKPTQDIVQDVTPTTEQRPRTRITTAQILRQEQQFKTTGGEQIFGRAILRTPKTKIPKIPVPTDSLARRLAKKAEEGGFFEAIGFRFGKEVKLGTGTKKEAETALSKFLRGTLGASGFLKAPSGKKIKAKETGLLKAPDFRISKISPFLIVEKKERRLKRGTQETEEIQFFRKRKGGKRNRTPFGI